MGKAVTSAFGKEVEEGLKSNPKSLSSKWFYDEIGDKLFVDIMNMPEYYLTNCEFEIFSKQTNAIIDAFGVEDELGFDLFELGAGDGTKTIKLLNELSGHNFTYRPIDISGHAIDSLTNRIKKEVPKIKVEGIQGEYFNVLESLKTSRPKIILFLGSNIGNLLDDLAKKFLMQLSTSMNAGDKLLLGVDLKKPKSIVLPAYNDAGGITAKFNLNLLNRINRELGGSFDPMAFRHVAEYSEETGLAKSFIQSIKRQKVEIKNLDMTILFEEGEKVFLEVSRKYDDDILNAITLNTSLDLVQKFYDSRKYFCDLILEKTA
ncbi:L-histidine N(alpha)-methyltransferase [Salibacteraceae bacterium]|nr:L-histidine N(alpha)-methyltransferase [Salibacteraceae bacterium]